VSETIESFGNALKKPRGVCRGGFVRMTGGSLRKRVLSNGILGIAVTIWAVVEQWPASRVIWQFWASSLFFGLPFFVAAIIIRGRRQPGIQKEARNTRILTAAALLMGLIALIPVLFFHSLYAIFLNHLFPILDWDPMGKPPVMILPFTWEILIHCLSRYRIFLAGMFLSKVIDLTGLDGSGDINPLLAPFRAVWQMHFLILLYGLAGTLGFSSNTLNLVLVFGFLQVTDVFRAFRSNGKGYDA